MKHILERLSVDPAYIDFTPEELSQVKNWNFLLRQAHRHSLLPLLYHNLNRPEFYTHVPSRIIDKLQSDSRQFLMKNLKMISIWQEILSLFNTNNILAITLKGPALITLIYKDPGLRPMTDLDFLVKPEKAKLAAEILITHGAQAIPVFQTPFIESLQHHLPPLLYKGIPVEIHSSLPHDSESDILLKNPWDNTVTLVWNKISFLSLAPGLLVPYLINHWNHHLQEGSAKLIWWQDLKEINRKYPHLLPEIPAWKIAEKNSKRSATSLPSFYPTLSLFNKLRFAIGILFPSPGHMRYRYGKNWRWMYLVNPIRLIRKILIKS